MPIRGRISQKIKDRIIEMSAQEIEAEKIAEETGASVKQVEGVVAWYLADENDETEEIEETEVEEETREEFWKRKYLDAHATLVENGLV